MFSGTPIELVIVASAPLVKNVLLNIGTKWILEVVRSSAANVTMSIDGELKDVGIGRDFSKRVASVSRD
jgi:hypothetical protein